MTAVPRGSRSGLRSSPSREQPSAVSNRSTRGTMADGMAERQRIGVALRDPLPWRDLVMVVETAGETGFEAAFFPEIPGGRDMLATITGLGAHTLRMGTGVVPVPSRRLPLLAMAAATAQERTGR